MIRTAHQFNLAMLLRREIKISSIMINSLLEIFDPTQYQALSQLRDAVHKKYPAAQALDSVDPLMMEGRAIMFNRQTGYHCYALLY